MPGVSLPCGSGVRVGASEGTSLTSQPVLMVRRRLFHASVNHARQRLSSRWHFAQRQRLRMGTRKVLPSFESEYSTTTGLSCASRLSIKPGASRLIGRHADSSLGHKPPCTHTIASPSSTDRRGPYIEDAINLVGLASGRNLIVETLKVTMLSHPTGASNIGCMI